MFCRNCGKEIVDGSKFCAECGTKFDVENTSVENTVANIESNANTTENTSANSKTKKKYPTVLVICILIFSFIAIMVIVGLTSGPSIAEDSEYISAAKTAISTKLKAPSTAIYSNENIEDQDSYGRTIVSFNCESQNSFGGYVNSKCYVLIEQYDTSTDKFRWNSDYGYQIDNFGLSSETFVEMLKEYTNWDEPFEDEEE